jgi:hypothetical protein
MTPENFRLNEQHKFVDDRHILIRAGPKVELSGYLLLREINTNPEVKQLTPNFFKELIPKILGYQAL